MDREKVIKGVHDARKYLEDREYVDKSVGVHIDAMNDAIALLTERGAVKPILGKTGRIWLCGNCGSYVGFEDNDPHDPNEYDKYCRDCGTPVLWEGR